MVKKIKKSTGEWKRYSNFEESPPFKTFPFHHRTFFLLFITTKEQKKWKIKFEQAKRKREEWKTWMRISFLSPEKAKLRRWNNDIKKKPETTNNEQDEDLWTPRMQNGENCDTALSLYFPFLDMKNTPSYLLAEKTHGTDEGKACRQTRRRSR